MFDGAVLFLLITPNGSRAEAAEPIGLACPIFSVSLCNLKPYVALTQAQSGLAGTALELPKHLKKLVAGTGFDLYIDHPVALRIVAASLRLLVIPDGSCCSRAMPKVTSPKHWAKRAAVVLQLCCSCDQATALNRRWP
jgi:hypothetical protein